MPTPPINRRIYKSPFAQDSTSPLRGGRSPKENGWGTSQTPIERARYLRQHATPAERVLWRHLRLLKPRGFHFRRQAPFGHYIADFACHRASLIVELDGSQHGEPGKISYDERRTIFLNGRGYTVLRFWNEDVLRDCGGVVEAILRAVPPPVPRGEGASRNDLPARGR